MPANTDKDLRLRDEIMEEFGYTHVGIVIEGRRVVKQPISPIDHSIVYSFHTFPDGEPCYTKRFRSADPFMDGIAIVTEFDNNGKIGRERKIDYDGNFIDYFID